MGSRPAPVHPRSVVPYVPATAVVFRRAALGDGYDESFRYGEDVDLVWRLVEAGWRVRYDPAIEVSHRDPITVSARLRRRFRYGTSVGPLERAHPGAVEHLTVRAGPAVTVCCLLSGAPVLAGCAWALSAARLARRVRPLGIGIRLALRLSVSHVLHVWVGLGRWCTTFGVPILAASALGRRAPLARRIRWTTAILIASGMAAGCLDPDRGGRRLFVDGVLGEMAYGLGVARGCLRARVGGPLLPGIRSPSAGPGPRLAERTNSPC